MDEENVVENTDGLDEMTEALVAQGDGSASEEDIQSEPVDMAEANDMLDGEVDEVRPKELTYKEKRELRRKGD